MNVLCPFCQNSQVVPDSHAGQTMACSHCQQSFQAPSLPPPIHAPSRESSSRDDEGGVYSLIPEPPAAAPKPTEPVPAPRKLKPQEPPPKPVTTEHAHSFELTVRPAAVAMVAPISLLVTLVLWLFSWTGAYPGGIGAYTQTGLQTTWAGHSTDAVGEKVLKLEEAIKANLPWDGFMFLYVVISLAALAFVLVPMATASAPVVLPPRIQALWPWRTELALGLATAALGFLLLQSFFGFGLERALARVVQGQVKNMNLPSSTPEEQQIVRLQEGMAMGQLCLERTLWYRLTLIANLVAVLGMGLEWYLRRHENGPLPTAKVFW